MPSDRVEEAFALLQQPVEASQQFRDQLFERFAAASTGQRHVNAPTETPGRNGQRRWWRNRGLLAAAAVVTAGGLIAALLALVSSSDRLTVSVGPSNHKNHPTRNQTGRPTTGKHGGSALTPAQRATADASAASQLIVTPSDLSAGWNSGPGYSNPTGYNLLANCVGIPAPDRVVSASSAATLGYTNGDAIISNVEIVQTNAMARRDRAISTSKKAFACEGQVVKQELAPFGEVIVSRKKVPASAFPSTLRRYFVSAGALQSRRPDGTFIYSVTVLLQKGRAEISVVQGSGQVSAPTADFRAALGHIVRRLQNADV
jgi:hypothetical protein